MPNRLAQATSPYLRQHADNPIDWWAWGPQALEEARRRQLPLLISVGYSACHWCHVMAAESFSEPEVAAFVNEHFVPIKVDREENPDVDQVLMAATQALTGQGGWPMTVFCTPDAKPFFAGTYFPPEARDGMPSFRQVCEAMAGAWQQRRDEVLHTGDQIVEALTAADDQGVPEPSPSRDLLTALAQGMDQENGGWGTAPKFPQAPVLDALLVTGEPNQVMAAQVTLDRIIRGGIHDVVGGGFHRYSVDAEWGVPHFEKMLYDNALLLGTLSRAWRRTDPDDIATREHLEMAVRGIVRWLDIRMRVEAEQGCAFAASMDADSPDGHGGHEEGGYYLWTPAEMNALFERRDSLFAQACFHLTVRGNMPDGRSTLRLHGDPDMPRLERILDRVRQARDERPAPARDDKVVASWNGLLAESWVQAAMVFGEPGWLDTARGIVDYLWVVHGFDGENAVRTSLAGVAGGAPAMLDDWAAFALGCARLAGATGDAALLDRARHALDVACTLFDDGVGGFFDAPAADGLYTRPANRGDEAVPSATSIAVLALHLVGLLSGDTHWTLRARQAEVGLWAVLGISPLASGWGLLDLAVEDAERAGMGRAQVVVVDPDADPAGLLTRAAWRLAPEGSAIVVGPPEQQGFGELFTDREAIGGSATAYVCRNQTCFEPITDFAALRDPLWRRVIQARLSGRISRPLTGINVPGTNSPEGEDR
ncbi:thioredoxin domain-containing protein [Propionibacterium sp.]|uniref:thioredoxin domain-containing protein n=1 Tax=Propionibacterium sp. TaxID=1977903 RepID=UPI0039EC5648